MDCGTSSNAPRYPRSVQVDFRRLEKPTLIRCLRHYGVQLSSDASQAEIATLVARHFETSEIDDEQDVLRVFTAKPMPPKPTPTQPTRKRKNLNAAQKLLDAEPAQAGEQVAAKVSKSDENGAWILANVLDYDPELGIYSVQDEDDISRVMRLKQNEVRRLTEDLAHFEKGDKIVAVFPDTTSFYRATISKMPKAPSANGYLEVIVKFEDDEDETGRTPHRRVPARFVMARPEVSRSGGDSEHKRR